MPAESEPARDHNTGLRVDIGRTDEAVVVRLAGTLDGPSSFGLAQVLADLIDGQGNLHVEVDLTELDEFDSPGLAVLMAARRRMRRHRGRLAVVSVPPAADEIIRRLG